MVDFNSEGAFSANKSHILELVVLGRRDEFINTLQSYRQAAINRSADKERQAVQLRGIFAALFFELEYTLKRNLEAGEFRLLESIAGDVDDVSVESVIDGFRKLSGVLDKLNMTKIDNKKTFDSRSVESENAYKGL